MEAIGQVWNLIVLNPMINVLIMLSSYLFNSFGLTIIVLTVIIRVVMYPLTQKQLHASKKMQDLQAEVAEIRKKYAKDRQKASQEQMRLYKESGMNPAGCLLPMLIQMPLWIALYQSIIKVLAVAPEDFLSLSQHLYSSWPLVFSLVPLGSKFLWLDLAVPDPWLILPLLVGGSMWVQQKMMMAPTTDPNQQAQSRMMLWMMPMMFAFLTLTFPSGLAIYWVTSNIISIAMQYFVTGWGGLVSTPAGKQGPIDKKIQGRAARQKAPLEADDISADIVESASARKEVDDGKSGDERQDRGGSDTTSRRAARRKPGGSGDNRRKRR